MTLLATLADDSPEGATTHRLDSDDIRNTVCGRNIGGETWRPLRGCADCFNGKLHLNSKPSHRRRKSLTRGRARKVRALAPA